MKEIKLKKSITSETRYFPSEHLGVFEHCCSKGFLTKYNIEYYAPIFEAHGYRLLLPYTLEESDIIYRVSDRQPFMKTAEGYYKTGADSVHEYEFYHLDDPYNFTSNENEL